jgi:hypothetical protein
MADDWEKANPEAMTPTDQTDFVIVELSFTEFTPCNVIIFGRTGRA